MNRLLLSDDAGNSVPIAMYDNWVFAGGTWRPETPGYIAGDTDDDENNGINILGSPVDPVSV
jgi:hypothetical protein